MADQWEKGTEGDAAPVRSDGDTADSGGIPTERTDRSGDRTSDRVSSERGLTDFVRRAVSAGVGAATRSKDDIMRAAASEMRNWLEHMDVNNEILKVLSKMVIEVKTEIRFRTTEDGKVVPETTNDMKVKAKE